MPPAKIEQTALFGKALFRQSAVSAGAAKAELEFGISRIDLRPNGHKGNAG
jgi:hypothetical protein